MGWLRRRQHTAHAPTLLRLAQDPGLVAFILVLLEVRCEVERRQDHDLAERVARWTEHMTAAVTATATGAEDAAERWHDAHAAADELPEIEAYYEAKLN